MTSRLHPGILAAGLLLTAGTALGGLAHLRGLEAGRGQAAQVAATAAELRSTSRSLQRDVLLMALEEAEAHAKTVERFERRSRQMAEQGAALDALLRAEGAPEAGRMEGLHRDLGAAMAGMRDLALAGDRAAAWEHQKAQVLPREIAAARTNDPVIERFTAEAARRADVLARRTLVAGAATAAAALLSLAAAFLAGRRRA